MDYGLRGAIKALKLEGFGIWAIARQIGCPPADGTARGIEAQNEETSCAREQKALRQKHFRPPGDCISPHGRGSLGGRYCDWEACR